MEAWLGRETRQDDHALPLGEGGWAVVVGRSVRTSLQPKIYFCMVRMRQNSPGGYEFLGEMWADPKQEL